MANLEKKTAMSAIQLAIVIAAVQLDTVAIGFGDIMQAAGHLAWLCIIAGGVMFYFSAYLAIRLSQLFPDEGFAEYVPRVWGKRLGSFVLMLFVIVFLLHTCLSLQATARQITFYMFDRTPYEIILITFLAASVYCALQDWGTILRIVQMMSIVGTVILLILLILSGVSLQIVNLFPLFEGGLSQFISGLEETWPMFTGYQIILVLMPLVHRGEHDIAKTVSYGFVFTTGVLLWVIIFIIGGLGVKTAQSVSFPMISLIRNVEIPGTFLERLDTYLIVIKVMIFFNSLSVIQYTQAHLLAKYFGHADHRPWVLAFMPVLFIGSDALHTIKLYKYFHDMSTMLGFILAFVIIPLTLFQARRRQKNRNERIPPNFG